MRLYTVRQRKETLEKVYFLILVLAAFDFNDESEDELVDEVFESPKDYFEFSLDFSSWSSNWASHYKIINRGGYNVRCSVVLVFAIKGRELNGPLVRSMLLEVRHLF